MGALGCKYCNCDREKMEDATEEMKIQYNNPIIITNGNNTKNNEKDDNKNENQLNKADDLNINIEINKDILKEENQNNLKNSSFSKEELNNNLNNIIIENEYNIVPIEESKNIFNNKDIINNEIINNDNNKNENNLININNKNNDGEYIIENNEIEENCKNRKKISLKESKANQFSITNTKEAKNKIKKYEINKIQFGLPIEDKESLNKDQQKLYNEAENNLQQFYAPQGNEMTQLQTIMSNILFKLKNIFNNIDLNSNQDDQEHILVNGVLKKMINYEINAHNTTMYSERFCILYPKIFKYYKSKEQFLRNLKPLCVLPINEISAVNIAKPKKSKIKLYHLIICNKLGIKKNINNSVFLNLFDSCEINEYLSSPDINESLLIFTSDKEQDIYKWYIVIQYLIEFSKK